MKDENVPSPRIVRRDDSCGSVNVGRASTPAAGLQTRRLVGQVDNLQADCQSAFPSTFDGLRLAAMRGRLVTCRPIVNRP